jgi:class 3 adenylate cyclase
MDCAVLFADVAGSTALYDVLGDERAFGVVESCLHTMSDCTAEMHGRVVKTIGDAVMAVFGNADQAAAAAAEMQFRVDKMGPALGVRLSLRIGFHHGPVVERDGDVFGDTVNLASRLCDLASKGQIITDRETAARLSAIYTASLRKLFSVPVKGKEAEVELVEILWHTAADEVTALVSPTAGGGEDAEAARLVLELGPKRMEMGPQRRKVTFGRDLETDFPVRNQGVSRAHAMIERRRGHFVLVDHSLNGTYVTFEGRPEIKVHREELTLVGQGTIAFGQPAAEALQSVAFRCVEVWRGWAGAQLRCE